MPAKLARFTALVLVLLAAWSAAGCARARAKGVTAVPPLDMPPPPPRVVETVEAEPLAPITLIEEPARQPLQPPVRPGSRAEGRTDAARPESSKADAVGEPPRAGDAPRPTSTLQTTPADAEEEVERTIHTVIARARADLSRVDWRSLNVDGRTQYDTAKRFIQQAQEALQPRTRNLVFAKTVADKALALAVQLASR